MKEMNDHLPPAVRGGFLIRVVTTTAIVLMTLASMAVDDADLARRQADQRRARQMARELVSGVLDLQLRQLEENGLTDLPIYNDIRTMRSNLAELVDAEMATVVQLLVAAQASSGQEREAKFVEARRAIRDVVIRLSVERQELLRRLKAAELAEQARRLIELQSATRDATASIDSLPEPRRAEAAVRTIEDQRDVSELFVRLVATLGDVRTWDGPIAIAASDGLRVLREADAGRRLDEVERALGEAAFGDAREHQDAVLESLHQLLAAIEAAQGAIDAERNDLAARVRKLREAQQSLHEQIKTTQLAEPPPAETVNAQQEIANALSALAGQLPQDPTAEPLRQQAESAARAATEAMFIAEKKKTLDEQQRAIERLLALEEVLSKSSGERRDRSAAELAEAAQDLERARDELKQAAVKHAEATRQRATSPRAASQSEKAAAEQTAKISEGKELPAAVKSRLADAAEAAESASEALAAATNDDASKEAAASESLDEAGDAFQRAAAAIEEALADTRRGEAAVRIGELARAAEALERAAAAEREIASKTISAARQNGLTADQTAAIQQIQADVTAVASKAAEGVKPAAPEAAATLAKAVESANEASAALADAAKQPGEPSKPAAGQASEMAQQTAQHLSDAAMALRKEIGQTAQELAQIAGEQMAPLAAAQQAVDQAAAAVEQTPDRAANAAAEAAEASAQAETGATSASQAARRAANRNVAQDASEALERAAISLAAREQRLRQDQQFAQALAKLAERQQASVDSIAKARDELASAPTDPAEMSPPQRDAARALHGATRQFAATQRATGQGAAQISGQQQVANVPIREALQTAERLPVPQLPGEPTAEPTEVADASEGGTPSEGQPGEVPNQPSDTPGAPSEGVQGASSGAQSSSSSSSTASSSAGQPRGLGTGLVPAAPDETASMMAGPDAQATLAALEAAGLESMEDVGASDTGTPIPDGEGTPTDETAGNQQAAKNAATSDGTPAATDTQTPNAAGRDAAVGPGGSEAGWFAKLPAEVRAAIRASSSQPAPKGYEGRLQRYFESVE